MPFSIRTSKDDSKKFRTGIPAKITRVAAAASVGVAMFAPKTVGGAVDVDVGSAVRRRA